MRRPAQHTLGWTRPYTGPAALAVFYNDGGQGGPPAVPSPADLAARTVQPPPPASPPVPAAADDEVLLDHRTGAPMTQAAFAKIMARENAKGRRNILRELAESSGVPLDPDDFDITRFGKLFKETEEARKAKLSEEQRRSEELEQQAQALQSDKAKIEQERAEIAEARRTLAREQALTRLGALDVADEQGNVTAPNLQDALAMLDRDLRENPDADATALTAAAEALKKRRPELFGAAAAPQTLPPAPSGGPAGGNTPRQPASSSKNAVQEEARKWADKLGYGRPAA
jgi:hypothetical protein